MPLINAEIHGARGRPSRNIVNGIDRGARMACVGSWQPRLSTLVDRLALFIERGDAFLAILGRDGSVIGFEFKGVAGTCRRKNDHCSPAEFARWAKYQVVLLENDWKRVVDPGDAA